MWRKGNPCTLLVGMWIGVVLWKTLPRDPAIPCSFVPKRTKTNLKNTGTPMFIASIIYNFQDMETNMCPSIYEWIRKCVHYIYIYIYIYNGLLLSINNNEIFPFAATWMNLVNIMLSEISQKEKGNTVWYHFYAESKKYNKLANKMKHKQPYRYREQTCGYQLPWWHYRGGRERGTNQWV